MALIEIALIAEGTSDAVLKRPIEWLCSDINPANQYDVQLNNFQNLPRKPDLQTKVQVVLRDQPRPQLILIHRDQDSAMRDDRLHEIERIIDNARSAVQCIHYPEFVPVIPITMSEAWFLISEIAIKKASGFSGSTIDLQLPGINRLESIRDPKTLLYQKMREASGLKGRHLKNLDHV